MPKIALPGHRDLTPQTVERVDDAIQDELSHAVQGSHRDIMGITYL